MMNSKLPLCCVVLGWGLLLPMAHAETGTGSGASSQEPKTPAKPGEQAANQKTPASSGKTESMPSAVATTPRGPALFKLLDTDKNGRVSAAEFVAYGQAPDPALNADKTAASPADKSKSVAGSDARNAPKKNEAAKPAEADKPSAAALQPSLPDTGILTSTSTRAGKYTAEVFEILDINHDKFLDQQELDALTGAHQISQP